MPIPWILKDTSNIFQKRRASCHTYHVVDKNVLLRVREATSGRDNSGYKSVDGILRFGGPEKNDRALVLQIPFQEVFRP